MKKSLILGAAALAAVATAPQLADAAEVKLGGYYQARITDADNTLTDTAGTDETQAMYQRVQLNLDAQISEKTSAHLHWRPLGSSDRIQGANAGDAQDNAGTDNDIKRAWMETEMYGVGVKIGNMPLSVNDSILFKDDGGSYGAVVLSKTFGGLTVVGLDVRVTEGASAGFAAGANDDEADIYGLSLVGKAAGVSYQFTWAHMDIGANFGNTVANIGLSAANGATPALYASTLAGSNVNDADDDWIALTATTDMAGINLTGTLIWESGLDVQSTSALNTSNQLTDSGLLAALRLKGKTSFGGWSGYGFYSDEDFTHPMSFSGNRNYEVWSPTWQIGGAGGQSLMQVWANSSKSNVIGLTSTTTAQLAANGNGHLENIWGIGAGLQINAGPWTIKPHIDYASVVEDRVNGADTTDSDSAFGGSIIATTQLDEGTTFSLIAVGVDPSDDNANTDISSMHALQAEFKVNF